MLDPDQFAAHFLGFAFLGPFFVPRVRSPSVPEPRNTWLLPTCHDALEPLGVRRLSTDRQLGGSFGAVVMDEVERLLGPAEVSAWPDRLDGRTPGSSLILVQAVDDFWFQFSER